MLGEFWPDIFVILLVCSLVSFANQKFGIFVPTPITLGSTALTLLLGAAGATRFYSYLLFGPGLFQHLRGSDCSPVAIFEDRALRKPHDLRNSGDSAPTRRIGLFPAMTAASHCDLPHTRVRH